MELTERAKLRLYAKGAYGAVHGYGRNGCGRNMAKAHCRNNGRTEAEYAFIYCDNCRCVHMRDSWHYQRAGGAGALVCAAIGTSAAAAKLSVLIASAYGAMDSLCSCMELIAPVLSAAIAASGEAASSAALSPLAAFLSGTVAGVFKSTVLPLCAGAGVCAMLSALTGEEKLSKLFKLIKSLIRWLSGAVFTLYFATVGIWGIGARSSDSVAVKTAKYAIDKGVPIVGGAVSGTVDTVLEGASLIKNSAGLAALVTLALVVLSPLASMACNAVCARGTAAVCSALGDARISTLMERVADAINGLFASVLAVAAMFMATCALALGTAGL